LSRRAVFYIMVISVGFGVALHDFSHEVYLRKGTCLSAEGGYVGFALMLVFGLFLVDDYLKWLGLRR